MPNIVSQKEYISRINKVIDYVNENLSEKINLDKLAEIACFSPYHFHRIFTAIINETPVDYVLRVRLEKAANVFVSNNEISITEIAFDCGFTSVALFSRTFKKHFGVSPKEFRNQLNNSKNSKIESNNDKAEGNTLNYFWNDNNSIFKNNLRFTMNVEVKQLPELTIAYVANYEGYFYDKIKAAWDKICKWGEANDLIDKDTKFIGISFDNPDFTEPTKCRYYASITINENTEIPKGIGKLKLPAGKYAVIKFEGSDDDFKTAYDEIYGTWLPNNGYVPTDSPCYEIYHSTSEQHLKGLYIVDICMPIKPL
ncbi:MAG TPA: GyrI-like domain-containing protein [Melioribacteraceae bacterium]|nr:GyrI-like domain-containing protein [Melioribacteraceae bacterium]